MSTAQAFSVVAGRNRSFAARLKALRAAAGLSQTGLARASGVPLQTIRSFEIARREPTFRTLLRLARGLGVGLGAFELPVEAKGKGVAGNSA
jgi:transcriptional regulator with XRE-family HTH domain